MRSSTFLIAALTAFATPVFAEDAPAPTTAPTTAAETVLPAITVSTVGKQALRDVVIASGLVGPVEEVSVVPMVQGQQIGELLADVGDTVMAGQVLARLSTSALSLQKNQLESSLAAAKLAGDQAQITLLQTQLDSVMESLSRKALTLSNSDVIAPVSGEITARNAQLGSIASAAGAPMFTIVRDGALELRADVSESDLTRLAIDQTAELTVVGATAPLAGSVRLVEPTIDTATRLGRVRISFADSAAVREGMFVEAAILVASREAIAVPVTAIGAFDGLPTVMTITNGEAARVTVTTGIRMGGWIEITSGLTGGETIVTKAGAFVRPGDHINPVQAPVAANAAAN